MLAGVSGIESRYAVPYWKRGVPLVSVATSQIGMAPATDEQVLAKIFDVEKTIALKLGEELAGVGGEPLGEPCLIRRSGPLREHLRHRTDAADREEDVGVAGDTAQPLPGAGVEVQMQLGTGVGPHRRPGPVQR